LNVIDAPTRMAKQSHELLNLPGSLVELETKIQELEDKLGNAELLNVWAGSSEVKAILCVQVALGFLYEAAVDVMQQKA
ncbi:hypothetical protein DFH28DRAFT_863099, partial [Melampsora americana]